MSPNDTTSKLDEPKKLDKQDQERVDILTKLGQKITELFQERAVQRKEKEVEWDRAQRLYDTPLRGASDYAPERPFDASPTKKRRPQPNIVRTKCDTAIANCVSMQFAGGEKNWDLFPPPNANDSETITACRLMEREIETQLAASKYGMHCRRAMEDRVILGSGVLKGPVNTGHMKVEYYKGDSGEWLPKVTEDRYPTVCHVPLWRFYPDLTVTDFAECCDTIEIHPMTALELSQYIQHPGFDGEAIKRILRGTDKVDPIKPDTYNDGLVKLSAEMWTRNPYLYKNRYIVLEYHGPVTYDEATKLGLDPTYESPTAEYYGEVWVCGGQVIRMELENIEGYYETPYSLSVWKRDPTSPFGYGHPLLLADPQRVVTQAYHMLLDNASLSSAPQFAMYQKYIQPIDGDWTLSPGKGWLLTDPTAKIGDALEFFNVPNTIPNIMPILQLARELAEEESATLASPTQSPDNSDTATGELIMRHASNTNLDFAAEEWDDQITEKTIRRYYAWNMQYNDKEEIKGTFVVDVKSSSEYKNKQMYIRDLERLQMETSQNPNMAMVINTDELVKARLALMHLPSNKIIKSDEEIAQAQQAAQNRPDPNMMKLQIEAQQVQIDAGRLELDKAQAQFEMQHKTQLAQMEQEEKMGANQARMAEAQASVLKARLEMQVELLKLAQNDEHFKGQLMNDRSLAELAEQSKVYIAGMQEARKLQENQLYDKELNIKEKMGSGI
jgi:hypothetical protein